MIQVSDSSSKRHAPNGTARRAPTRHAVECHTALFIRLILLAVLLLFGYGCATEDINAPNDKFFREWRAKASESRGKSPAPVKRTLKPQESLRQALAESQAAPRPLPRQKITLSMHQADVGTVLRAMARAVNQNIMINDQVRGTVDIRLQDVPWDEAFTGILRTNWLTYEWQGDIIRVITQEDKTRELERLETDQRIKAKEEELRLSEPLLTQIVEIEYANAEDLKENLTRFLTQRDKDVQMGSVMVDKHTNALIIQAIRSDLTRMLPLIEALDRPTPQILIEAHIVEASKTAARKLGVQWGGMYSTSINSYRYYNSQGNITNPIGSGVTPGTGQRANPETGTVGNFPANLTATDIAGNLLGLNLGFLFESPGGDQLSIQLQALEDEGQINILASPNITTSDNQLAFIESGQDVPYQTVEDDEVKIEYKSAVLRLEVTPHVIDNQTVKMDIFVTKDDVDFANAVGNNPVINTKKAQTAVILFNGQTTVIGGLTREQATNDEYGIPYLKDVPGLGKLFSGRNKDNAKEELLIFVTPHILEEQNRAVSSLRQGEAAAAEAPASDSAGQTTGEPQTP